MFAVVFAFAGSTRWVTIMMLLKFCAKLIDNVQCSRRNGRVLIYAFSNDITFVFGRFSGNIMSKIK